MSSSTGKRDILSKQKELLIAIGLLLWLSIFNLTDGINNAWGDYLSNILVLLIAQSPVLLFYSLRTSLRAKYNSKQYLTYWVICFVVAQPALTTLLMLIEPANYNATFFLSASAAMFTLELLFICNFYYQSKVQHISWIKKIGLENAVLVSIVLFSLTISVMAVSSLNNPELHTKDQLLIGFVFKPSAILQNLVFFLKIFAQFLFMYLCGYLFFYINSRFLVANILRKQGFLMYVLALLAIVALLYPFVAQLLIALPINETLGRDIFSKSPFEFENAAGAIGIMLFSLPIILALQWAKQNNQIVSLEREKSQTELDLLKQQLNPHFFFNTLNNLYALSLQKSDKTPESILQLSDLMRYVIYKGQEPLAPLSQELKHIEDYIQLQQMRLRKPLQLEFIKQIANETILISPLLLIVLIENAFKHGIEPAENTASLHLQVKSDDKTLHFICENSFEPPEHAHPPGIGLSNLQRRLELLYPDNYVLTTNSTKDIFKVELKLMLT